MVDVSQKLKMAVIAGASKALKVKEQNIRMSDSEVLKQVAREMDSILGNLDQDF